MVIKEDLRKVSSDTLKEFLSTHGEKPFRAKQINEWLWKKAARSIDDMTNLSISTRKSLQESFEIRPVTIADEQKSNDGTIKFAFKLYDGHLVEGVLIPAKDRMTACISSQVGCSLACKFCATGYIDRKRNLDAAEIFDQVVLIRDAAEQHYQQPLTNIVYMGMGEPLLNFQNVLDSIEYITSEKGLNMSPKRITVSTAGIAKMIKKLGDLQVKFNLALSLHAANDEKRDQIMPINETNTLNVLSDALKYFHDKTKSRITFEYITFHDFNDSIEDAKELLKFAKGVPSKINIIEYNPIAEAQYEKSEKDNIDRFQSFMERNGVTTKVRRSRGKDIDAACGQLAGKKK